MKGHDLVKGHDENYHFLKGYANLNPNVSKVEDAADLRRRG